MTKRILEVISHLTSVTIELVVFVILFNTLVHLLLQITQ